MAELITVDDLLIAIYEHIEGGDVSREKLIAVGNLLFEKVEPTDIDDEVRVVW